MLQQKKYELWKKQDIGWSRDEVFMLVLLECHVTFCKFTFLIFYLSLIYDHIQISAYSLNYHVSANRFLDKINCCAINTEWYTSLFFCSFLLFFFSSFFFMNWENYQPTQQFIIIAFFWFVFHYSLFLTIVVILFQSSVNKKFL